MEHDDSRALQLAIDASVGLLAAGAAVADPALGVLAAGAAPAASAGAKAAAHRMQQRAAATVGVAAATAGVSPEELVDALIRDERRTQLLAVAIQGAYRSAWERRIRVLGHSLATGALVDDDALVDEEIYWVGILSELEAPHLRMIEYLLRSDSERPGHMIIVSPDRLGQVSGFRQLRRPAIATLERHALTQRRLGSDLAVSDRHRWSLNENSEVYVRGPLTKACFDRFLEAGVAAPRVDD
ncbi:hypothetical protein [Actinotalea subterranea]|uniref:hypothetical protein n=1 Tax=Actinotalea subterranea TaxID=2607497 RepID=UPI0011ED2F3C|nr:hypothetical protein [Actinotalea subterranea]